MEKIDICVVCAWRATCQKKFSISGRDIRCPDFTRDISIKDKSEEDNKDCCTPNPDTEKL